MRVSRLDTSTESKQRLNDAKSWVLGRGRNEERAADLARTVVG